MNRKEFLELRDQLKCTSLEVMSRYVFYFDSKEEFDVLITSAFLLGHQTDTSGDIGEGINYRYYATFKKASSW